MTDETPIDCQSILAITDSGSEGDLPSRLRELVIIIDGDHVSGSIDYSVAQSIIQLQQIVYRIAAHALYGEAATVKNLTESDLEKFKLSFKISPGCTEITSNVLNNFINLLKSIFKDMSPAQRLGLAAILAATFLGYIALDRAGEYFSSESQKDAYVKFSEEETKRLRVILENTSNGGNEASANFAKAVKGASSLQFGGRSYSSEELANIQKRTPRTPTDWVTQDSAYVVTAIDVQKEDVIWANIRDIESGETFKASYTLDEDDSYAQELLSRMANSMLTGSAIKLKVSKGKKPGDSKVIKASILEFIEPAE